MCGRLSYRNNVSRFEMYSKSDRILTSPMLKNYIIFVGKFACQITPSTKPEVLKRASVINSKINLLVKLSDDAGDLRLRSSRKLILLYINHCRLLTVRLLSTNESLPCS